MVTYGVCATGTADQGLAATRTNAWRNNCLLVWFVHCTCWHNLLAGDPFLVQLSIGVARCSLGQKARFGLVI